MKKKIQGQWSDDWDDDCLCEDARSKCEGSGCCGVVAWAGGGAVSGGVVDSGCILARIA